MSLRVPLYIFAKRPEPGHVKTRLLSQYSPEACCEIARILLRQTLQTCVRHWPGEVVIAIANGPPDAFLQSLAAEFSVRLRDQAEGDLGQRMLVALQENEGPSAIIGADVWITDPDVLLLAHHQLSLGQGVIGPSDDGGYYLIGFTIPPLEVFDGIDWGTEQVMAQTEQRLNRARCEVHVLPTQLDIDTPADLKLAASTSPTLRAQLHAQGIHVEE